MWSSRSPATPDREKTLQGLLDALTRPRKWTVATLPSEPNPTVSFSPTEHLGLSQDTTWTIHVMNDSVTTHASTDSVVKLQSVTLQDHGVVTVNPTTSAGAGTFTGEQSVNFWYRYGISITVAILVFVVAVVLIIHCRIFYQKRTRRRRLVDFVLSRKETNKAREEIFESFHRQAGAESMPRSRLQSISMQEEIPMRFLHNVQPCQQQWRVPPAGQSKEPLARVYPLHREPARDVNANITDPFPCEAYRRLWNTTASQYPILRGHRTVVSEPVIARPSSHRYSSRTVRGESRMPRYNLSGCRILTPPESNAARNRRYRPPQSQRHGPPMTELHTLLMHEVNTPTPKLVVPTNTPNTHCTDSGQDNTSPYGPGLDSDFGASAGITHFTVSSDNTDNAMAAAVDAGSVRDATYEWDTYDPAYMNCTVSYRDGAYFPVLQRKQYWV